MQREAQRRQLGTFSEPAKSTRYIWLNRVLFDVNSCFAAVSCASGFMRQRPSIHNGGVHTRNTAWERELRSFISVSAVMRVLIPRSYSRIASAADWIGTSCKGYE